MFPTPPILTPPETPSASDLRQESPTGRKPYHLSTLCVTVDNPHAKDQYGSSSVPIYQTATFKGKDGEYDYTRSGNPTRSHLEYHLAKISNAKYAFAVSSGMTALDVIMRLLKAGDEIITTDNVYGGTNRLLTYWKAHQDITINYVDMTRPESLHPVLKAGKTAMVLLESPTNPLLKIADLATICSDIRARAPDAIIVVDNTMMSSYLQRPLEHGADLVYDSGAKYLSGHHDLMAGVIKLAFIINAAGNALSPFDSFLLLRGTKTLAIRMERQQSTAIQVAKYLSRLGFLVHYPGLEDDPGYELHKRLANGPGAVLSFETGDKEMSQRIMGGIRLWGLSVGFGGVNSLIGMPCVLSIDPKAVRPAPGLPEDLIRLCVGIEDPNDLIDDLEAAMLQAGAIKVGQAGLIRTNPTYTSPRAHGSALNKAIEKLADHVGNARVDGEVPDTDWMVSAPGKTLAKDFADEVNQWALVAEKVLHGNPSGVDNAVAVYGGALAFTKPGFAFANPKGGMDGIQGFKSVRFLLVNTKVPRNTKSLVAGVGLKKEQEPELVNGILERIQAISDEGRRALLDPELERSELLKALESLIDENHAHLVTLGVSHPALEKIREVTAERGLHAKLTGAGGGGCAVVLLPDTIDHRSLNELIQELEKEGFEAYTTSVGGGGLGILSPYAESRDEDKVVAEEDFVAKPAVELARWAADRGRWLYT
ncbi:cystathionine beta-lyase [Tulasnella sp. UAMH 9824]|nr:cystathionine beta-lyase [Tulasnella sp. UAMH 9824]